MLLLLAVVPSSLVACCFKNHTAFILWSVNGGTLFLLHAVVAIVAISQEASEYEWSPAVQFSAQIVQCCLSLLTMCVGCKTASAVNRQPIYPVESQIGTPLQLSTHPAVADVQHSPVIHMSP